MFEELKIFLTTDQSVQCPYCGRRTNWLADFSHTTAKTVIHECINHTNGFLFIVEDDNDNIDIFN